MTDRRRDSVKARRIVFETHKWLNEAGQWRMTCHMKQCLIDPIRRGTWRADHIRRWAEGGEDTPENLRPICINCDLEKAPHDTREVAKGKRVRDSLYIGNPRKKRWKPEGAKFNWSTGRYEREKKDEGGDFLNALPYFSRKD